MDNDVFWNTVPAFAISGFSGSGKTTLIEQLVPQLVAKGLNVAVLKHDVHGVQVDYPGKDSDRLYQAGADVVLQGADECFVRRHGREPLSLQQSLQALVPYYDLVLVEGFKEAPLAKIWLLAEGEAGPPKDGQNVLAVLSRDAPRLPQALALLESWLPERWCRVPVYGCVLIGGKSTRMGRPKHLLEHQGRTWLEHTLDSVSQVVDKVVIGGRGEVPSHLSHYTRLADISDVPGPLAGMVAAMRWAPQSSWLMCACDMPQLSVDALRWLLQTREPGVWATVPDLLGDGHVEPLLAHYDPRARPLFETLLSHQCYSPSRLASQPKINTATPPVHLLGAWRNVNSEAELATFQKVIEKSP